MYRQELLQSTAPIDIDVKDAPVKLVLDICFKNQRLTYNIVDNLIVLSEKVEQKKINSPSLSTIDITGKVTDTDDKPLAGINILVKGTTKGTITNEAGEFNLKSVDENASLIITSVSYEMQEVRLNGKSEISVQLKLKITELSAVAVTVNNGYQEIDKTRMTGSFVKVDNGLLHRKVSFGILERIENVTTGVLFNRGDAANTDPLLIRGRSTIFADAKPLIILDDFPYDGDLGNINPNDIESIVVLRDAAASSIWGARAGNGVIVVTTKKGKAKKISVEFNTNVTIQQRPDLFNVNTISSSDYIDLEKKLYAQGYYAFNFNLPFNNPASTPVVNLLNDVDSGRISMASANSQIEAFRKYDARNDLKKYFYQNAISQQNSINVNGDISNIRYYLSIGWDNNSGVLVGSKTDRVTLRNRTNFKITKNLQFNVGLNYSQSVYQHGNNPAYGISGGGHLLYPYARLADDNGNSLPVSLNYSNFLIQKAKQSGLFDWQYYPLDDISNNKNVGKYRDYLVNAGLNYNLLPELNLELKYQYQNQLLTSNNYYYGSSFFARNLINLYTQVNTSTGVLSYPIPKGGILDASTNEIESHQGRLQINYNKAWYRNQITAIGGYEIRSIINSGINYRLYGYKPEYSLVSPSMDFVSTYILFQGQGASKIPNPQNISRKTDHFLSYYINGAYTYDRKYTLSLSGRKDEANLFGVKTNQKGTPLWSVGIAWDISKENFYKILWLPFLKFRATYGASGNISRLTSAYTTIYYNTALTTSANTAFIDNPPNEKLRWERVKIINIGCDFALKNDIIRGTIEYYTKRATDLMGQAPIDPTYGLGSNSGQSFFYGNVAGMQGRGLDIQLDSRNLNKKFKWYSTLLSSHVKTKVTKYLMPVSSSGKVYLNLYSSATSNINPVIGKSLFAVYSYRWGGLDPSNGDPLGFLNGSKSKSYGSILGQTPLDSMVFNGSSQPTVFGAFRNTFEYKGFSLSVNVSYKLGYYFRRKSIYYSDLLTIWSGHGDYSKRWQKPGDESNTTVPSVIYSVDQNRDFFYANSQILVEKGDNIRLEDIRLAYQLQKNNLQKTPFQQIQIYMYVANLGTIWVANNEQIDPYFNNIPKDGKSISFGVNASF
jgi:TonB-linked SusC/RagA family outer membrane protein